MSCVLNKVVVDHDRELARLVERLWKKYPNVYSEIAVEYVTAREIEKDASVSLFGEKVI